MMPGESQPKMVPIAADATFGNCQNCSVMYQNLSEYVSSFLALKQRITLLDDTIGHLQQLEELQIKVVTLEKKTADYETLQAELEAKKSALEDFGHMSEELEQLKQEKSDTLRENKKLEDQLKDVKEFMETKSLENSKLKREKAALENDLLKTQTLLKKSQAQADEVEKLKEENVKTTSIKDNLASKVGKLEESASEKNLKISQLTKENILLERNIDDLQARLLTLERERCKEFRSISTQAGSPEEPKVDKEKVRVLLENLWACVEPEHQQSANLLHLHDSSSNSNQVISSSLQNRLSSLGDTLQSVSHRISDFQSCPTQRKATCTKKKPSRQAQKTMKHQTSPQFTNGKRQTGTPMKGKRLSKEDKTGESSHHIGSPKITAQEIMELFKPLPPCVSPVTDLDTVMEVVDTGDREMENISRPPDYCLPLRQDETTLITTAVSNHCLKSSTLLAEENVDASIVRTQEAVYIPNNNDSKDFRQNDLCDTTKTTDKKHSADEEICLQKDIQIEPEPATVTQMLSASSSFTAGTVLAEDASLSTESQEPRGVNVPGSAACNISETNGCCNKNLGVVSLESTEGEESKSQSQGVATLDVDTNSDVNDAKFRNLDGSVSPRQSCTLVSEEALTAQAVNSAGTSQTYIDLGQDSEVTNDENQDCSVVRLGGQTTIGRPQENAGCLGKDSEMGEDSPCRSNSNIVSTDPNKTLEERKELLNPLTNEIDKVEQGTVEIDVTTSSLDSNGDIRPPVMKMVDANEAHDQERCNSNDKTPLITDIHMETLSSEKMADVPPLSNTKTVNCQTLKESQHLHCVQLNTSFQLSTTHTQLFETNPPPEKDDVDVNDKHLSTNNRTFQVVPSSQEERSVEKTVSDLPQDKMGLSDKIVSKPSAAKTHTSTSKQSAVAASGNKCTESLTELLEKQSKDMKGGVSPAGPVAVASASTSQPSGSIGQVRSEMGPPLPCLLTPLRTPPKATKPFNPRHAIGKLLFPSPMDRLASPTTPVQTALTPNSQQANSASLNSPLHPNGVPSSPLQFGSATPKHAVPVPGRLPVAAIHSSPSTSSSPSQENSMRILDTMYPELSARARTLSILRGNFGIGSSECGMLPPSTASQMSGFKTINSTSTAFTKTEMRGEKRCAVSSPQPKNSKYLRLNSCSPGVSCKQVPHSSSNSGYETSSPQTQGLERPQNETLSPFMEVGEPAEPNQIVSLLKRVEMQCFDLLPVIRSHLHVGKMPTKPVLTDEEKEVISEICQSSLANDMILAILSKLKTEKNSLHKDHMQALCRVYTGICRQRRDFEKAHILAYSILTEDFPECAKLILFMVTTWPSILSHKSYLCQAVHTVTKLKAHEDLYSCLSAYLGWEKSPPCDIDQLISRTLFDIRSGSGSFSKHSRYGEDLETEAWAQVFALHLLCSQKTWRWTYENVMGKELWPLMNTWVTQPRDQQAPVSDVTVATVLRLIGRLCQLGIKEKSVSSVLTVANVINTFGRHGRSEGVPWEVQLAAVYCIYDLSPCNPKEALDALAGWRGETCQSVPSAVTSCINQLACVCRQVKS